MDRGLFLPGTEPLRESRSGTFATSGAGVTSGDGVRWTSPIGQLLAAPDLDAARERVAEGLRSLPWEGLALSRGEPAIPTRQLEAR